MTAIPSVAFKRAARRIDALADEELPARALLDRVSHELRTAMPIDALFMAATDPQTGLAMGAGVAHDMPQTVCRPFWEYEFEVPDFNKFDELARGPRQVADLHEATGGRPERSARWREFRTHMDADAELRAAFNAGGRTWGILHANRAGTVRGFSADELAFMDTVAPVIGRALRRSLISHPARPDARRGPGMAIVDGDGRVQSATPEAFAWFEDIDSAYALSDPALGSVVPSEVMVAAAEARARGTATRSRAWTHSGVWLLIHASRLHTGEATAVVIEPAKASEVAPLIVDAYELTPRELDVTRALARGLTTSEIACELHLSRYTVQDHLKAIYEKVGVSSRGELVAKVFADHHIDGLRASVHAEAA